jgi:predicted nicotinamide N-methyase
VCDLGAGLGLAGLAAVLAGASEVRGGLHFLCDYRAYLQKFGI